MEDLKNEILDADINDKKEIKRRKLLPWWMKVFVWFFMVIGIFTPIAFLLGQFDTKFILAIYGLQTYLPNSTLGIFILSLFFLKGITALGLWTEKEWAIKMGKIDAYIGLMICFHMMLVYPFLKPEAEFQFHFRGELLLLIPYLIKLGNIQKEWSSKT